MLNNLTGATINLRLPLDEWARQEPPQVTCRCPTNLVYPILSENRAMATILEWLETADHDFCNLGILVVLVINPWWSHSKSRKRNTAKNEGEFKWCSRFHLAHSLTRRYILDKRFWSKVLCIPGYVEFFANSFFLDILTSCNFSLLTGLMWGEMRIVRICCDVAQKQ